jgi:hypothetical protein
MTDPKKRIYSTSRSLLLAILASYVCFFVGLGINIWYTNKTDRGSNSDWCPVLDSLTASRPPANADAAQIEFYQKLVALQHKKKC